jgi:membrane protease YdiL (CAAX protease family)
MSGTPSKKSIRPQRRYLFEVILVIIVMVALAYISPALKTISYVIAVVYVFWDMRRRHRSWSDIGISLKGIGKGIAANWYLITIVAVVIQFLVLFIVPQAYLPNLLNHIIGRLPLLSYDKLAVTIGLVIIISLVEELIFRGLIQERIGWYVGQPAAVLIASIAFGLLHYSPGPFNIVATDIGLVVLDGVFYGLIFSRCRNIFVSWIAHMATDLIGLLLLLALFNP